MRYDKYKSSSIDWFADIPSHWQIRRLKDVVSVISKGTTPSTEGEAYTDFGVRYIKAENINDNGSVSENPVFFISESTNKLLNRSILKANDLLLVIAGATTGKIAILKPEQLPANTNQAVCFLRLKNKEKDTLRYKFYFINSTYVQSLVWLYAVTSAQPNLPMAVLSRFSLYYPPIDEQKAIAQYLDIKTQAIDKKIKLLSQKADYYKDLRKSIINDAVCKGLDKNVTLQESEFIFSVNAQWKRHRLKDLGFLYSGLSGKAGDDFNQDDNPNNKGFIPFTNIANNTYLKANHLGTVVVYENEKQNKVRKGDLFFLMSSEGYDDVGKTAALAEDIPDTYLNSFCKGYRITKKNCEPYFLNFLLLSDNYRKSLITEGKGFTRINLKMEKVTDFFVYLPPTKEEQIAIANYLDEKTQKIDAIVANIGKQIETLKELRKTLINDVVTGKIKVTNN
jgi:type I restriction enzyme S subunit